MSAPADTGAVGLGAGGGGGTPPPSPAASMISDGPRKTEVNLDGIVDDDDGWSIESWKEELSGEKKPAVEAKGPDAAAAPAKKKNADAFDLDDFAAELRENGGKPKDPVTTAQAKDEPSSASAKTEPAKATEPAKTDGPRKVKLRLGDEERALEAEAIVRKLGWPPELAQTASDESLARAYQKQWLGEQQHDAGRQALNRDRERLEDVRRNTEQAIDKLLQEAGLDLTFEKVAERRVARQIEEDALSPEQRENRRLRQEIERRDAEDNAQKERKAQAERAARASRYFKAFDEEIDGALTDGGFEPDPVTRMALAAHLRQQRVDEGDLYEEPRSREEMRRRAAAIIPKLTASDEAAVERVWKRLGAEGWRKRYPKIETGIGEHIIARHSQETPTQVRPPAADGAVRSAANAERRERNGIRRTVQEVLDSM